MRFRTSILIFGAFAVLAAAVAGGSGFYGVRLLRGELEKSLGSSSILRNQMQADMMHDALRADALNAVLSARNRDAEALKSVASDLEDHIKDFNEAISAIAAAPLPADIRKVLDDLAPDLRDYLAKARSIVKTASQSDRLAEAELPAFIAAFEKLETSMAQAGDLIQARQEADANEARQHADSLDASMGVLLCVVVIAVVIAIIFIQRRLFAMLGGEPAYAARVASRIAQGHLDDQIVETVKAPDSVLATMRRMQQSLRERLEAERTIAAENLRIRNALDNASTSMMLISPQGDIAYCNEAARNLLSQTLMRAQQGSSPSLIGQPLAALIPDASLRQSLLDAQTTRSAEWRPENLVLKLSASPVMDGQGQRLGTTLEWLDRSAEARSEAEFDSVLSATLRGDFSQRLNLEGKSGFFRDNAERLNALLDAVSNGLRDVAGVLSAMSHGDLTQTITRDYDGLLGELRNDTNSTVARLRDLISGIQDATHLVSRAASEIASGNNNLSARTEAQAASLEQTASTIEELNATVSRNAENAHQASTLANDSNSVAHRGGAMVARVVNTMHAIQGASRKIADIISIIDSIAFQTNILALNAAVEAARAGEQGRGFAVVASEVRNLAQRSAAAAQEIKSLIATSVGEVDEGVGLVSDAGQTMTEIVSSFENVSNLVANISSSSRDQARGIQEMVSTIARLDETTQQNAALVEQAAAAAASLSEQARELGETVATFRLRS
ncbi:methyl-accepting chemotaxis protein [Viridibacterium curvum]|uniref:Methyl-accepting chemotaxis protein n=1 Tax=Viridibacterium curvum TaxID=1101404 RepID=A0ABP9QTY4_9RHOO